MTGAGVTGAGGVGAGDGALVVAVVCGCGNEMGVLGGFGVAGKDLGFCGPLAEAAFI